MAASICRKKRVLFYAMEIKTKFSVYQEVYNLKEEYCMPRVIEKIETASWDFYSRDIGTAVMYELEGVNDPVDEELLVGTKEEWVAGKVQAQIDRMEDIKREIQRLTEQQ